MSTDTTFYCKHWSQPHLAQEVSPVDLGSGVTLQLGACGGGQGLDLLIVTRVPQLMIGALDPVAPKLRKQDEREGAPSAQHLEHTGGRVNRQ